MALVGDTTLKMYLEEVPEKTTFLLLVLILFITELDTWITGSKLKCNFEVLEEDIPSLELLFTPLMPTPI